MTTSKRLRMIQPYQPQRSLGDVMRPATITLVLPSVLVLGSLLAAAPDAGVDPISAIWRGDDAPSRTQAPCPFVPRGTLVTLTGSSSGVNLSAPLTLFVLLEGSTLVAWVAQEGELERGGGRRFSPEETWPIACEPGAVVIDGHRISFSSGRFRLDTLASFPRELAQALATRSSGFDGAPQLREQLEVAQASEHDALIAAHPMPLKLGPAIRLRAVAERVFPSIPLLGRNDPDFFWRGNALCIREGEAMRCLDPHGERRGATQPSVSPFAQAPALRFEFLGHAGEEKTQLTQLERDGGLTEPFDGPLQWPSVLARTSSGRLLVVASERPSCCATLFREEPVLVPPRLDVKQSPGSGLLRGGLWFVLADAKLRARRDDFSWELRAPGMSDPCTADVLISPDEHFLACVAGHASPGHDWLWLFPIAFVDEPDAGTRAPRK